MNGGNSDSDSDSDSDESSDAEDGEAGIEICSNLVHDLVHGSRSRPVLVMADSGT